MFIKSILFPNLTKEIKIKEGVLIIKNHNSMKEFQISEMCWSLVQ